MPIRCTLLLTLLALAPAVARADTADRLLQLVAIPGLAGYESHVREAIEMMLPLGARVRADNLGNILLRTGNGAPHTLIVAPLDESGLVVSAVTDGGYLRVHRHTTAPAPRLATQYLIGQPIEIRTASGRIVPGVTATPSSHLSAFRDAAVEARIKTIDDIWIDVGAESRADVEALGVRLLDSVTLRERSTRLAGTRVSGVAASSRAAALAMVEIIRRSPGRGATGSVSFAWVVQSEYGNRGLIRMVETLRPDRVIQLRRSSGAGEDARGAVGRLGAGPLVIGGDEFLSSAASRAQIAVQPVADPRATSTLNLPASWKGLEMHVAMVPVLYAQTPVETVDARDVDALAEVIAAALGLPPLSAPDTSSAAGAASATGAVRGTGAVGAAAVARATPAKADAFEALGALIESYGVSGHEGPVREEILKRLPPWAKARVDERGNIAVTFGKGKPLLFVAHMDEVGFEIVSLASNGTAAIRTRGGMYLSLYEAHPVIVHTPSGPVAAVLSPRAGYTTATEAEPQTKVVQLDFGTDSEAATRALGVDVGHSVTVRKEFVPLASGRATGRSMDDRVGSAALLLALAQIDPTQVTNEVTFAWSVEEETGLVGATHLATAMELDTVFAIDTFVSSDTPVDVQRLAGARLGGGAVLRVLDSRTIVSPHIVDRVVLAAKAAKIPLQLGTTSGGTDASAFSAGGALDIGLSWPGRYSHSPVEIMDRRDLDALVRLIVTLAQTY